MELTPLRYVWEHHHFLHKCHSSHSNKVCALLIRNNYFKKEFTDLIVLCPWRKQKSNSPGKIPLDSYTYQWLPKRVCGGEINGSTMAC